MPYDRDTIVAANRAVTRLAHHIEAQRAYMAPDHPIAVAMMAELEAVTAIVGEANRFYDRAVAFAEVAAGITAEQTDDEDDDGKEPA